MSDESLVSMILQLTSKITLLEARIAILEAQSSQTGEIHQTPIKRHKSPDGLPEGTIAARDFYREKGVPTAKLRQHTERGLSGDFLETTNVPHKTRPDFIYRYLTLEQQEKALQYWDDHGINYEKQ